MNQGKQNIDICGHMKTMKKVFLIKTNIDYKLLTVDRRRLVLFFWNDVPVNEAQARDPGGSVLRLPAAQRPGADCQSGRRPRQ